MTFGAIVPEAKAEPIMPTAWASLKLQLSGIAYLCMVDRFNSGKEDTVEDLDSQIR